MYFPELPSQPNFSELENRILAWWQKQNINQQYLQKNSNSKKTFSFIDGPITANGPMGVHHARGRTLKDVFQRFKNANGYAQRFQNGFDCQGLWVEVEVEKEQGFNSKKDIQDFGLANFTESCLARVDKFSKLQTEQSKRLGMFMDWNNSYYTNSQNNNLYIWNFLKKVHQKGWLVKRKSATTWCPRCETGLSQHEEADGYQEIQDQSVYLKFKLTNRENEYLLAWTTTPWTLPANVLLALNTNFQYVKANIEDQIVYLAEESAKRLGISNYELIDATTLLNLPYDTLFDIPAQNGVKHYIVQWDEVNPAEGTGIVHIAPGCGQEDFNLGKKLKADMLSPLDETGHFNQGYGELSKIYAHDAAPIVFQYLKSINSLYKIETITHRYPHCWRCKTKCLFRLEDSWYISSDEIRPHMKEAAQKVNWHPKYVGRRMQNWLDSMEDWMISRKRFYGLALPFYECSCNKLTVIGSKEELKELAINPSEVDSLTSLHRPWIDKILIKCPNCQKPVSRVPDVGDCWLDAGVVPFSTLKYLEDKTYWQKWFPADLVLEMIEQVRLWFYSMLFFSVTFENTYPYKNVVAHGEVRDEKGERMSKTKKNGIAFDDAISQMGADAMRWLYCQQKPHTNVSFGYNIADQVKRGFFLILWNSYRFFTQHANLENWTPPQNINLNSDNVLDRWILSRLNSTIYQTQHYLDKFNTSKATENIENFVSDLSTWYIRRSRDRNDNLHILYHIFKTLVTLLGPFIPFLSESIYQNLLGQEFENSTSSIHLEAWPQADKIYINAQLESEMDMARRICQSIHSQRQIANLKIRQPLAKATVYCESILPSKIIDIIQDETNLKEVQIIQRESDIEVILDTNLTPELISEGEYRALLRNIQSLRREQGLKLNDQIKIIAPSWPKEFEQQLLKKTLATSISNGPELSIQLS